eukprot:7905565-Alexandrium_andersonii.AAC.1
MHGEFDVRAPLCLDLCPEAASIPRALVKPAPFEKPEQLSVGEWRSHLEKVAEATFAEAEDALSAHLENGEADSFWVLWCQRLERAFAEVAEQQGVEASRCTGHGIP